MSIVSIDVSTSQKISPVTRLMRSILYKIMQQINVGYIEMQDDIGSLYCGDQKDPLKAKIVINHLDFYYLVFAKGDIGFAIAFMHKYISVDNLTNLLLIFAKNLSVIQKAEGTLLSYFFKITQKFSYVFSPNTIKNAKQRIMEHYDLSNDLFKLFLDKDMSYSCLMFATANDSLEQAAQRKIDSLLSLLQLQQDDHVIEIGTGWGALAISAAMQYACNVTTTTISDKQYNHVKDKISSLGLNTQISLLNQDYRKLQGKYNKLISVEMIEAVGYQYLKDYFQVCSSLLHNDGLFALQAILIKDSEFERAKSEMDFIKKFIFPGGCLPSMNTIISTVATYTDLSLVSCIDITYDYALTLKRWRSNFLNNKGKIIELGFDEYFMQMWEYYFSYCEAGFLNRNIMCVQLLFAKPGYHDPRQKALN